MLILELCPSNEKTEKFTTIVINSLYKPARITETSNDNIFTANKFLSESRTLKLRL